ncbi:MAG: stress response translation initiation inhibitor YciH [Burkholderiaceae bacterium]|jgi:translation initiation factor 1
MMTNDKRSKGLSGLGALTGLVYSTEVGQTCPDCRQAIAACVCGVDEALVGDGQVRVLLERRGGKLVTVVSGLAVTPTTLVDLGKSLRQAMGSGGTAKAGVIEVQGDHVTRAAAWLKARGHRIKVPKA